MRLKSKLCTNNNSTSAVVFGCYYGVYLKLRIVNVYISIRTDTVKEKLFELETLPSTLYIHENGTSGPSAVISTRTLLLSSQALSYPLFLQLSDSWETRLSQAFWFYPDRRKLVSTSTTSTNNSTTKLLPSQEPFLPQLDTPTHTHTHTHPENYWNPGSQEHEARP